MIGQENRFWFGSGLVSRIFNSWNFGKLESGKDIYL